MTKTNTAAFGKAMREARIAAGRTQGDVASFLAFSTSYVCDMERGYRSPPDLTQVAHLAHFLRADLTEFVAARARYYGVVEVPLSGNATEDAEAISLAVRRLSNR